MSAPPPYNAPPPLYTDDMSYNTDYSSVKPNEPPPAGDYPPTGATDMGMHPTPGESSHISSYNIGGIGNIASFSDKAVRRAFVRKVYLILMAQLGVTIAFVCLFMFVDAIALWVQHNSWFYYTSYGVFIVTMITLICCPEFRRNYPKNFICLLIFTLALSYMVGTIASYYTTDSVLIAVGITAAVCLSISIFAMQTKIDFTMCSGLIFALSLVVLLFGLSVLIVYARVPFNIFQARVLHCVYGGVAALLVSLFLVYDTQVMLGGRKHELDPEEYIYASLQLYLDVTNLFVILVTLIHKCQKL